MDKMFHKHKFVKYANLGILAYEDQEILVCLQLMSK